MINPHLKQLWPMPNEMLHVVVDNHLSPATPFSDFNKLSRQPVRGTERALSIDSVKDRWGRGAETMRYRRTSHINPNENTKNSLSMRNLPLRQPVRKASFTSRKPTVTKSRVSPIRCARRSPSMDDVMFLVVPSQKNLSLRRPVRQPSRSSVFRKESEISRESM